jgi:hypothetical protein
MEETQEAKEGHLKSLQLFEEGDCIDPLGEGPKIPEFPE